MAADPRSPIPLTVLSYNLHGFNQGEPLLSELCSNVAAEVIFVQEHWLSSINMNKLSSFSENYYCICTSAMENAIQIGILRGRPFGGIAILVHKNIVMLLKLLHCPSALS